MRTTVTLDPDVAALLRQAMRDRDLPFKQVLNAAIRDGLRQPAAAPRSAFAQPVFDLGTPLVDLTKAGTLAAELEDLQHLAKTPRE